MHFTKLGKANYYDCDGNDLLKISAAMRYMQQTSSEHLESIDLSPVKLYREGMVFLLAKMCIKVHRMPRVAQPLVLGTAATETRGPRFVREFAIDSADGERLISALSLWILVEPETRKILRPAGFPYALPFVPSIVYGAIDDIRFPKLLDTGKRQTREIEISYSHLDTNRHVNNSIYADFVCDSLPYEMFDATEIDTLVIGFQNEAKHGDLLQITTGTLTEKEYYLTGRHGGEPCFEALAILK